MVAFNIFQVVKDLPDYLGMVLSCISGQVQNAVPLPHQKEIELLTKTHRSQG